MASDAGGSEHSSSKHETATTEVGLSDASSIVKEKYEVSSPRAADVQEVAVGGEEDYPDGGLRAWLIVCGVRDALQLHILAEYSHGVFFAELRLCATLSRRKFNRIARA